MWTKDLKRRMARGRAFAAVLGLAGLMMVVSASYAMAQAPSGAPGTAATGKMVVATKEAAPFSFKGEDGAWRGISIDLLRAVAGRLNLDVELREDTLEGMIRGVASGKYGAAIAAVTISPTREETVDFTYPYFSTGAGIAVSAEGGSGWLSVLRRFFSYEFLVAIASLAAVLLAAGFLVWLFERKANAEEFGGGTVKGLGDGFWWAAVTMTTVGYGDKSPRTLGGRIVALIWMFTTIIIIASFTAAITSSLTVGQLGGRVTSADDLPDARVGVLAGAAAAETLNQMDVGARPFDTVRAGFDALRDGKLDAFVHDRPILQYIVTKDYKGEVRVLPDLLDHQDYGIVLPENAPLREQLNRAMLRHMRTPEWSKTLSTYLGNKK